MYTINICNLKGGVGKTITSVNMAYELASRGYQTLLIDNDPQGNASQFYNRFNPESEKTIAEVLTLRVDIKDAILGTSTENLDIVPANLNLDTADREILQDVNMPQQIRLKEALETVKDQYDYVIIDNMPHLSMPLINALVAGNDYIIPVKIDKFTFDGCANIFKQASQLKRYYNPQLNFAGCLVTSYRRNEVNKQGESYLEQAENYKLFDTHIRWTDKVDESTFACMPIAVHSPRSGAAHDYTEFVTEYLKQIGADKR